MRQIGTKMWQIRTQQIWKMAHKNVANWDKRVAIGTLNCSLLGQNVEKCDKKCSKLEQKI